MTTFNIISMPPQAMGHTAGSSTLYLKKIHVASVKIKRTKPKMVVPVTHPGQDFRFIIRVIGLMQVNSKNVAKVQSMSCSMKHSNQN